MSNAKTFADPGARKAAIENLRLAKQCLDSAGVSYWLACGTLLACLRDGALIEHDTDIDLGVMVGDCSDDLIVAFDRHGLILERQFGKPECGLQYSFRRLDIKLDVFAHYESGDGMWMAVWSGPRMARYVFPRIEGVKQMEFCGEAFSVPSNAAAFVEAQYGADWETPRKHWEYFSSPYNIQHDCDS